VFTREQLASLKMSLEGFHFQDDDDEDGSNAISSQEEKDEDKSVRT
jgi:hypothetical protein